MFHWVPEWVFLLALDRVGVVLEVLVQNLFDVVVPVQELSDVPHVDLLFFLVVDFYLQFLLAVLLFGQEQPVFFVVVAQFDRKVDVSLHFLGH